MLTQILILKFHFISLNMFYNIICFSPNTVSIQVSFNKCINYFVRSWLCIFGIIQAVSLPCFFWNKIRSCINVWFKKCTMKIVRIVTKCTGIMIVFCQNIQTQICIFIQKAATFQYDCIKMIYLVLIFACFRIRDQAQNILNFSFSLE